MRNETPVYRVVVKTYDGELVTKIVNYESVEEMYIIEESLGNTVVEYWCKRENKMKSEFISKILKSEFISKIRFHLLFMKCPICGDYILRKRPYKNCYLCGQDI